jgi:hypothetical protein
MWKIEDPNSKTEDQQEISHQISSDNPNPHSSIGNSKIYIKLLCENSRMLWAFIFHPFLLLSILSDSLKFILHYTYIFPSCCWINIHKIRNSTIINSYSIVFYCLFLYCIIPIHYFSHLGWFLFLVYIQLFFIIFLWEKLQWKWMRINFYGWRLSSLFGFFW